VTTPDLVLTGLVEAQTSLDPLTRWQLRPATVTIPGATAILVKFDGEGFEGTESVNVPAISLIGYLARGARVMVMFVPPAGNYVIADLSGATTEFAFSDEVGSTTSTSYVSTGTGLSVLGLTFIVPASGKTNIIWGGSCNNSGASFTLISPQIAEGSTIDAGSVVVAASNSNASQVSGTDVIHSTNSFVFNAADYFIDPGTTLNATLYHLVGAGTGLIAFRRITAVPER